MRRSGFGWWRLAKQVVLGAAEAVASYANSTLVPASNTGSANGSTANTHTLTLKDGDGAVMPFKVVTFTTELTAVDAAETTLVDDATQIATTTGTLNLILTIRNADGTPLPNIQSARIVFASTGTGNTFGTPSVTDRNGVSTCTFSSTVAEAKTISVTVDGVAVTQTAAVTVTGTPAAPTLVFNSRWQNSTGDATAAMTDGSAWNGPNSGFGNGTGGGIVETLASLALTKPSELSTVNNAFVTRAAPTTLYGQTVTAEYDLGLVSAGTTRYFRSYMACIQPNATGDGQKGHIEHGYETANTGGGDGWNFVRIPKSDGTWRLIFRDITSGYRFIAWNLALDKNVFYRVEHAHTYGATTYTTAVRIYAETGALIGTDADFWQYVPSENASILLTDFAISYTAANHRYLRVGNNGPSSNYPGVGGVGSAPSVGDGMHVMTAYAYSTTEWCGPYISGNG